MKVKLCGFTELESLQAAIKQNVDYIGFVFHKNSPRDISIAQAKKLATEIPENISIVAVLVEPDNSVINRIAQEVKPDFFQIHGFDNLDKIQQIRRDFPDLKIIKAISVNEKFDENIVSIFEKEVDHILLDNKNPGSGQSFDWNKIKNIKFNKEWFLSGGLNCDNIKNAVSATQAPILDISSGIEEIRGKKSTSLINKITTIIKTI